MAACSTTAHSAAPGFATFYARGQTGQQLLLGAYQALMRQVDAGTVTLLPHREMLDLVVVEGRRGASSAATWSLASQCTPRTPSCSRPAATARLFPVHQRGELERHRDVARAQARRPLRQSVLHADPPDVHPGHRRASVQAHADERVAAQRRPCLGAEELRRQPAAREDPRSRSRLLPRTQVSELRQPRAA